jgi:hypothetical protein
VAAFIRSRGITRCPTACAFPTQGTIAAADRAALGAYAAAREKARRNTLQTRPKDLVGGYGLHQLPLVERLMTTPVITGPVTVLISVNTFCSSVNGALAT